MRVRLSKECVSCVSGRASDAAAKIVMWGFADSVR
jgi:hypothetical protein